MLPFPDRVSSVNPFFGDPRIRFVVKIQSVDEVPEEHDQRVLYEIRIRDVGDLVAPVQDVGNPVGRLQVESFLHAGLQFRHRTHHSAGIRYLRPHWPLSAWTAQPASALSRHCFEKICRTWDTCSGFRLTAFATSS